ncbi:MAG: TrmH family RNA methyltransferase, partial [Wenzhouxiangellaceae bacterium]
MQQRLDHVRIVLDHTTHPGNIGSAARAMKVMGLDRLDLIDPSAFPDSRATALASSADDLLDRARIHETLIQALDGCTLVMGTSARQRSVAQPLLDARLAAERALAEQLLYAIAVEVRGRLRVESRRHRDLLDE